MALFSLVSEVTVMNKEEVIVEAARRYFESVATSGPVEATIDDPGLEVGDGRESWLVRLRGAAGSLIVAVEIDGEGRCEARHHVRYAA